MDNSSRAYRDCLGHFATGVTVVTTLTPEGEQIGVTVNSFSSVSLHPPLILFSLGRAATSTEFFQTGTQLAVNILSADQISFSRRFSLPYEKKWDNIESLPGENGAPILPDCLGTLEARIIRLYEGGDHHIFLCEVSRFQMNSSDKSPLLFYQGKYWQKPALIES